MLLRLIFLKLNQGLGAFQATRYDKLARNYASSLTLAFVIM
jgi:hypothetical protein